MSESQITTLEDKTLPKKSADKAVATPEAAVIKGANHDSELSGKFEMLTVFSTSEDGGSNAVPVGINGYAYQIPRDKPFKVPTEVAQILREAITTVYKAGPGGAVTESNRPRYSFTTAPA